MRVLLALDGSTGAEIARSLVAAPGLAGSDSPSTSVACRRTGLEHAGRPRRRPSAARWTRSLGAEELRREMDAGRRGPALDPGCDRSRPTSSSGDRPTSSTETATRLRRRTSSCMGSRGRGTDRVDGCSARSRPRWATTRRARCSWPGARPRLDRVMVALRCARRAPTGVVDGRRCRTVAGRRHDRRASAVALSTRCLGPGVMFADAFGSSLAWYEDAVGRRHDATGEACVGEAADRLAAARLRATGRVLEGDPGGYARRDRRARRRGSRRRRDACAHRACGPSSWAAWRGNVLVHTKASRPGRPSDAAWRIHVRIATTRPSAPPESVGESAGAVGVGKRDSIRSWPRKATR